jgi:hypothetical protein
LLEAVAAFLLEEVNPKLATDDKGLAFRVLIAANLANIVAQELKTHDQRFEHEAARLLELLPQTVDESKFKSPRTEERSEALANLERELASRLRDGRVKVDKRVLTHLIETAKETLSVTNPRFELSEEI